MRLFEFREFENKAIFTAGLPGAGKSSVINKLLGDTGLRIIDVDKFYALDVAKGNQPGDYPRYTEKAGKIIDQTVQRKKSIVLDGTGTNVARYAETKKTLEDQNYKCLLLYVATDFDKADQRAQKRASVTGRSVDVSGYHQRLNRSFDSLTKLFDTDIVMVDNNPDKPELMSAYRKIHNFLKS